MSIIASSCNEISNSPLNTSKSKQLFSFPHSPRFNGDRKLLGDNFYDLPPVRDKRAAGIGYGTKYDFTKGVKNTPPPNAYQVRKEPGSDLAHWSFGLSREQVTASSMFSVNKKGFPGPGAYDIKTDRSTQAFSIRARTENPEAYSTSQKVPGPGSYPLIPAVSKNGKYFYAKYKDSGAPLINSRAKRFVADDSGKGVPGPGQYEVRVGIPKDGNYFNSKFHSSMCRSFSQAPRGHGAKETFLVTPGPGTYRVPSDFGYYESKGRQNTEAAPAFIDSVKSPKEKTKNETKESTKETDPK